VAALIVLRPGLVHRLRLAVLGGATVEERVAALGKGARARLQPFFAEAALAYPPERFLLAGFKSERLLELYAAGPGEELCFVRAWPVLAASGGSGPKLREGDLQVPEGFYRVESLNPNSRFHLALRLDYPNRDDRERAARDGRSRLGGDIMIHGGSSSVGCLAIGDDAIEELFVLAAETGPSRAEVLLAPLDFRRAKLPEGEAPASAWVAELYAELRAALGSLPPPRG
jgi:hypothetical protein